MMLQHLRRMARYNRWANERLYAACGRLPAGEYHKARQAFFGSMHGTLSHVLVADRLWLARIGDERPPALKLDDQPYGTLDELEAARAAEDQRIIALLDATAEDALPRPPSAIARSPGPIPSRRRSICAGCTCSTTRPTIAGRRTTSSPRQPCRHRRSI